MRHLYLYIFFFLHSYISFLIKAVVNRENFRENSFVSLALFE